MSLEMQHDAAPGIHRVTDAYTNWYIVEDGARLTIVDAGTPRSWDSLEAALDLLGRSAEDIEALVLTHAHFDHVGMAERMRTTLDIPVHVHEADVPLSQHPSRYDHERPRAAYLATQPRALPIVATLLSHRAFWPEPIGAVERYGDEGSLPVPGAPRVVPTPGHTYGHCALHFPDRDAVIAGDAVVMLDPYTGRTGPRLVARAATADVGRNLRTLDALAATGARTVLTGHGPPATDGAESVVAQARSTGAA